MYLQKAYLAQGLKLLKPFFSQLMLLVKMQMSLLVWQAPWMILIPYKTKFQEESSERQREGDRETWRMKGLQRQGDRQCLGGRKRGSDMLQ